MCSDMCSWTIFKFIGLAAHIVSKTVANLPLEIVCSDVP